MPPERAIKLDYPLAYRGKEYDRLVFSGHPLGANVISSFGTLREKISLEKLDVKAESLELDQFTIDDLRQECLAYSIRSISYCVSAHPFGTNYRKGLQDLDQTMRNVTLVAVHAKDQIGREAALKSLPKIKILRNMALAIMATYEANYAWARTLINESFDYLEGETDIEFPFQSASALDYAAKNIAVGLSETVDSGQDEGSRLDNLADELSHLLENINLREKNEPSPSHPVLPDPAPLPSSLHTSLGRAIQYEHFEYAAAIRDEIVGVTQQVQQHAETEYLRWFGQQLITKHIPRGSTFICEGGSLAIYTADEDPSKIAITDFGEDRQLTIRINSPAYLPNVLGLVHSDANVLRRNRMDTVVQRTNNLLEDFSPDLLFRGG